MHRNVFLTLTLILSVGCFQSGHPTLTGKVIHEEIPDLQFASDSLELQSVSNSKQLAFGGLSGSGEFTIESLQEGKIVRGAPAGRYRVRLIVSDDDSQHKKEFIEKIATKYLSYEQSGWTVDIPGKDAVLVITGPSR